DAVARLKTAVMKGTRETPDGRSMPIEITIDGADRILVVASTPNGAVQQAFNGKTGWVKNPRGVHEMDPGEIEQARGALKTFGALKAPSSAEGLKVIRTENLRDRDVFVVAGEPAKGTRARWYFDTQSGLLLRSYSMTDTMLGALPDQTDFDDYRDVGGVKLPFAVTYSNVDPWFSAARKFASIQANVAVDRAKFDPPPGASK